MPSYLRIILEHNVKPKIEKIISCLFTNVNCLFTMFSYLFTKFSCLFTMFSCLFTLFTCLFTMFSCLFTKFSCLFTLFSCLFTMFSCLFTMFSCLFILFSCFFTLFSCLFTMFSCLFTLAAGCISMFCSLQMTGASHPLDCVHFILSIWSVKCLPKPKSSTGGLPFKSEGLAGSNRNSSLKSKDFENLQGVPTSFEWKAFIENL